MIQGSKTEAESGNLLGNIGSATKMNLVLNTIIAVPVVGLAEGMALSDRAGLPAIDVINILRMTSLKCLLLLEKGKAMIDNNFQTRQALKHLHKDLSLSLDLSYV
ncbi:6-phosphogluconate dehydrogenase, domain 2,3-hydroxyisobutyrate dehydrogenase, NAD-binding domain,6- [Cinara cedri]|uniref:6-phosphogluconate dehydrogenase, domain 2,3-hydroxyisobutyrate dehydrogenase, NAD-binding domain,6 n=1 Tax=Cinara cedri TaxID=506608 RepID=A0A5E4LZF1_9HEMI|nr:6-phosphogluconate dehydrogenase, domain 2,3-hydroxyisobutyrate dehydrogenase, NAD-binding domain,6- [Cinara cedri]